IRYDGKLQDIDETTQLLFQGSKAAVRACVPDRVFRTERGSQSHFSVVILVARTLSGFQPNKSPLDSHPLSTHGPQTFLFAENDTRAALASTQTP
ncbi:hypothetical protein BaRGS_00022640, partial [Batillaria attramentaria]